MPATSVKHFTNFERALLNAQNGPYGQADVDILMRIPSNFQEGTQHFYDFCFDLYCPWHTMLRVIPRFTRLFEFRADFKRNSIDYVSKTVPSRQRPNEKQMYAVTKYDGITSAGKCLHVFHKYQIWRACLFVDIYVVPYLVAEMRDVIPIIRNKLCGDLLVPTFNARRVEQP